MTTKYPKCGNDKELYTGDDVIFEGSEHSIIATSLIAGEWFVSLHDTHEWIKAVDVKLKGSDDKKPKTKLESNYTRMAKAAAAHKYFNAKKK